MHKSEIYFNNNVSEADKIGILDDLGVRSCIGLGKYIGIPFMIERSNKAIYYYINDMFWKRIVKCSHKHVDKFFLNLWCKLFKPII